MTARPKLAPDQQMTIEEFLAFADTRPEEERWELIEGVAVMNPAPIGHHQMVVSNILAYLIGYKRQTGAR
jgi:Uma2 family endonuclease